MLSNSATVTRLYPYSINIVHRIVFVTFPSVIQWRLGLGPLPLNKHLPQTGCIHSPTGNFWDPSSNMAISESWPRFTSAGKQRQTARQTDVSWRTATNPSMTPRPGWSLWPAPKSTRRKACTEYHEHDGVPDRPRWSGRPPTDCFRTFSFLLLLVTLSNLAWAFLLVDVYTSFTFSSLLLLVNWMIL